MQRYNFFPTGEKKVFHPLCIISAPSLHHQGIIQASSRHKTAPNASFLPLRTAPIGSRFCSFFACNVSLY